MMFPGSFFTIILLIIYIEWKFTELQKFLSAHATQAPQAPWPQQPKSSQSPQVTFGPTPTTQNLFVKTPAAMSQLLFDDSSSDYAPFAANTRLLE